VPIDIDRVRHDTPGCEQLIHFNNAGASLPPRCVLDASLRHLQREAQIGGYEAEAEAEEALRNVRTSVARLLGCHSSEVALMESATRAWDMAFYAVPLQPGDRILTCMSEYGSNYIALLHAAQRTGAVIEVIPNDESGQISVEALESLLDDRVKLVAITHVPTNGGLVNPAKAIGNVVRDSPALYLLDACQSAGQIPLDVEELGCDMLSATGRKFLRGPRGTGFLYVRKSALNCLNPPFLDMQAATWTSPTSYELSPDATRFETWETNVAARLGFGAAVDYALEIGLENIHQRVTALADDLRSRLSVIPRVTVRDLGKTRCGITTFTVDGMPAKTVREKLSARSINVWTSPASSTLLDMRARGLDVLVRASVHYYNTENEVERFCAALREILKQDG
jgi:selenocysteine lyase/cysteine desulfurase